MDFYNIKLSKSTIRNYISCCPIPYNDKKNYFFSLLYIKMSEKAIIWETKKSAKKTFTTTKSNLT